MRIFSSPNCDVIPYLTSLGNNIIDPVNSLTSWKLSPWKNLIESSTNNLIEKNVDARDDQLAQFGARLMNEDEANEYIDKISQRLKEGPIEDNKWPIDFFDSEILNPPEGLWHGLGDENQWSKWN